MRSAVRQALRPAVKRLSAPVGSIRGVRTTAPHVVLTFDDGPEPGGTEVVLEELAASGATATFFVLVDRARLHPALLRAVTDAGHEIGLHGWDHTRPTRLGTADLIRRCRDGRAWLEQQTGRPIRWYRPPYGAQTPRTWLATVHRCGLESVVWGPTTWDWLELPVAELCARARPGLVRGSILLSHDGYAADPLAEGPVAAPPCVDRASLTRAVLAELDACGLVGRSLGAALAYGSAERWAWFRR